jgi:hypothetical protein
MRRMFAAARYEAIPPRIRDVLYKILVSGHHVGHKCGKGKDTCDRCSPCVETLEHVYAECPKVRGLWLLVLDRWKASTMEDLQADDLRVTLLGDRGEQDMATSRGMWRIVHAATIWVIHRTRARERDTRESHTPYMPTTMGMLKEVQRELQRIVTAAWVYRGDNTTRQWAMWRTEGCGRREAAIA